VDFFNFHSVHFCFQEKEMVLGQLAEKARMVTETFNSIPGMSCNTVQGAMYAFPQIKMPPKAIAAAKVKKIK
jgi:alanine transaminase